MKKIIIALLLLTSTNHIYAQNKASIKGVILDSISKAPIEHVTVAIVYTKDTSLISYTITDSKGHFLLSALPANKQTKVIISFVGYNTIRRNLDFTSSTTKDFGKILMTGHSLNEVIIQGERSPIVIKKDTIEFNTEAFKTRPNAVVEELLRKLPGVQVNIDGSILVDGKPISKLMIDGKDFFGSDPKVATRNLDADMIDKIQVYDDRENDPDHKLSTDQVEKIINLKLKNKIKKSTLGKIYVGGGTRQRYEAGGIISSFRDTLQVSLIGLSNNLTKTGFSREDLNNMGGFNRGGGDQTGEGTFGGNSWGGMEKITSAGFNINNDYGTRLKTNLVYFYTNTNTKRESKHFSEQTLIDTVLSSSSKNTSDRNEYKHSLGGLIEWKPDTLNRLRYEPKLNFQSNNNINGSQNENFNNFNPKLYESIGNDTQQTKNIGFSHNFSFYRKLKKKGESIHINHSLALNENATDAFLNNNLTSYTNDIPSSLLSRFTDQHAKSYSGNLSVNYNYPISKKVRVEITSDSRLRSNNDFLKTFDKNTITDVYDIFLANQSNDLTRQIFTQSFNPQLNYQLNPKYTFKLGLNATYQDVRNKFNSTVNDINKTYLNLFPAIEVNGPGFSVNYREGLELPSIWQLQPIERIYNQISKSVGNPGLEAGKSYNIGARIYKNFPRKQINFNLYSSITLSENNVVQRTIIDGTGVNTRSYVNRDGGMRGHIGGNIGKQFKKSQNWKIGLNTSAFVYMNKSAFFLNTDEGIQQNYDFSVSQSVDLNYRELLSLNTSYRLRKSIANYKNVDYKSVNTNNHSLTTNISLRWPKKVIIDGRYNFNYNPQVPDGFTKSTNILNLSVSLLMQEKDRGQLKLSVYDLLDQSTSVYQYGYNNAIVVGEQNVLKQYFLLTYQYKLNIFKSK
ncbi:outer membrane beta-barrel protein [Pedobacter sp. ASV1-7]|uniref:outer membrane beta-barrel protein n=1 Tax=Pedobacter sp. ASV1-7 TaxID=3145237 RepID=UPI0032E9245F